MPVDPTQSSEVLEDDEKEYEPPSLTGFDSEITDWGDEDSNGLEEHTASMFARTSYQSTALGADSTDGKTVSDKADPSQLPSTTTNPIGADQMAKNIENTLKEIGKLNGFIAAAIVDSESGMTLGMTGGNDDFDIEVAAAANTDVVQAKLRAAEALGLDDHIDDILITLSTQYHLIRPIPDNPAIFIYAALDRKNSNLALARMNVNNASDNLGLS